MEQLNGLLRIQSQNKTANVSKENELTENSVSFFFFFSDLFAL